MTKGDAAAHVLASETLFREITSWLSGVLGLVVHQWRGFNPEKKLSEASDDTHAQFLITLFKNCGQRGFELALQSTWNQSTQRFAWHGFAPQMVQDANATMLEFLFVNALLRDLDDKQKTALWRPALTSFPGSVAVLELLLTHVAPLTTGQRIPQVAWKEWMEASILEHEPGLRQYKGKCKGENTITIISTAMPPTTIVNIAITAIIVG